MHTGRLVGVSLKTYLGLAETDRWLRAVADLARSTGAADRVDLFVLPSYLSIGAAGELLAGTGVRYGSQDVGEADAGPFTGEVSAPMLREAGCAYAAVGHAERRRMFGEDDAMTARKAAAAARAGLVPVVCVGEVARSGVGEAVAECLGQLTPVLAAVPPDAEVVVAYEPVWAIGAAEPADSARVLQIACRLRPVLQSRPGRSRLIYGGSAGPGLFASLAEGLDGLFLGRFAHDIDNLAAVLAEVSPAGR